MLPARWRLPLPIPERPLARIAYMSPEQARGRTDLTPQSDQFSLYELASGKRAFQRGSAAEVMTAIIREDAEPLPASVPAPFRWIVERLLAKEPEERYDSTRDLYRELRQVRERFSESISAGAIPAVSPPRKRRWLPGAALVAAGLVLGAVLAAPLVQPAPADFSEYKFTALSRDEATERFPRWSPDGKSIVYTANVHGIDQLFTKAVGSRDTTQLTHAKDTCAFPSWSPDGSIVHYESNGNLWAVSASGGNPEVVKENVGAAALFPTEGRWCSLAMAKCGPVN
jgi:eukaryotic-like serine/threonine-protein kinase